jgi:hypothetical protein
MVDYRKLAEVFAPKTEAHEWLLEADEEIRRLREALREICEQWDDHGGAVKMKEIARRALEEIDG